ncbi:MAG: hypothetical protein M1818_008262 [Claussenomyces sp. TS43310]|nr:MAG: hypothetical protein M1818_008262 [Claussenomyces sp. TS43310]
MAYNITSSTYLPSSFSTGVVVPSYSNSTTTPTSTSVSTDITTAAASTTPAGQSTITNMVVISPTTLAVVGPSATPSLSSSPASGRATQMQGVVGWASIVVALLGLSSVLVS